MGDLIMMEKMRFSTQGGLDIYSKGQSPLQKFFRGQESTFAQAHQLRTQ